MVSIISENIHYISETFDIYVKYHMIIHKNTFKQKDIHQLILKRTGLLYIWTCINICKCIFFESNTNIY